MASEEHVEKVSSSENAEKPARKIENTVLDNFSNLVKPSEKVRIKSSVNLLRHLAGNEDEKNEGEVKYALGRIIRGLGSSTVHARTGFYTALAALLNLRSDVSVEDIFNHLEKQLHKAGSNTKGENADICVGQILTCGAIVRSNLWTKCSEEEKKKIIEMLLKTCKERTYLSLVGYTFIADLLKETDDKEFKTMFQLIKDEFSKPWTELNIDTLYLLLCVKNKNSSYLRNSFLQKTIGTNDVICAESLEELSNLLMTIPRVTYLKHPLYEIISKELATSKYLKDFILAFDKILQRQNRNKQLIATKIYSVILQNLQDTSLVPHVLSKNFIQQMLTYFKTNKDTEFQQSMHKFFETLLEVLKKEDTNSTTKITVLKKLLFYPGTFIFEKVTKSKIIQQITYNLDSEGVKMLATLYEGVVQGTERIDSEKSQNENWLNNDRLYAAHLLIKLLNHAAMKTENEWKMERLSFLMHLGLLKTKNSVNIGSELAASLKTAFFGALDLKLPKLEDLQVILYHLVEEMNSKLTPENLENVLKSPITTEEFQTWQKTIEVIRNIEKKKKKKSKLRSVFLTLFLHMGLQLFNDAKLATDSLKELFVCYEKTRKRRSNSENLDETEINNTNEENKSDDPVWIEVVTDLFLNLLSHNYHLLRNLIKCVFPHLCQYMTATTIHQILSVIDPKNEDDPLSKNNEESDEESEEVNDEESEDEDTDKESEEEEDTDMEDESTNDKLRMALHKVLSTNGYQTDEESIDLDQMSETEGEKLDFDLAEAFRKFRPNHGRRKKQSKDQETLTHFRIRVLDLVQIYLDSTPSMILALEIMLPLLQAVEFSIRDEYQKPLHDRLKACLKKLSLLKKFSDTDGVDDIVLSDLLKSLLEKGTKNTLIIQDMGVQIADCCIFIIRCSDVLMSLDDTPKKVRKQLKHSIADILSSEFHKYFHQRDSLTPFVLFKNTVQLSWDGILRIVPLLLGYIFSNEVKPFKKNQALELLQLFYLNKRYIGTKPEKIQQKLSDEHSKFFENVNNFFESLCERPEQNIKEKFIFNLFNVLSAMKNSMLNLEVSWSEIAENIREYRSHVKLSKDAKIAFNKLCKLLGVSNIVIMKSKTTKITDNAKDDDDESIKLEKKVKSDKKKKKTKNKEKLKLKKEAKELRLSSLSEGFRSVDFTTEDANLEEGTSENENVSEMSNNKRNRNNLNNDVENIKKRKKNSRNEEQMETSKSEKKNKWKKNVSENSIASNTSNDVKTSNKRKSTDDVKQKKRKKIKN